jgi:hypothetical protein
MVARTEIGHGEILKRIPNPQLKRVWVCTD